MIYNGVDNATDHDDLNAEIGYFVHTIENYFDSFNDKYRDKVLTESEENYIKRAPNILIMKLQDLDLSVDTRFTSIDECVINQLKQVALVSRNIQRTHAQELVDQLINSSVFGEGTTNFNVYRKMKETLNSFSDLEFRIFRVYVDNNR